MERVLSRPFLQVCSQCYKDFLRNLSLSSSSKSSQSCARNSRSLSVSQGRENYLFKCNLLPKYSMLSAFHSKASFLAPGNVYLTRNFATESEPTKPSKDATSTHQYQPLPSKSKAKSKENSEKSPISWKNLVVIGAIGGLVVLGMKYVKQEKEEARQKAQNRKMGKAKLGGEWTLTDHNGKLRSSQDFRGQWLLIYFGFTNCPDICPEEMEKIVNVLEKSDVDPDLPKVQPIIITVDPARDTPEALKEYCAEFSPRLLGFSGTEEQIQAATRAYRVYFSAGPKDEDNDYIVDHSIISYLVNPEGEFVDYFGQNKKVDEIYKSMKLHILSYQKKKSS